MPKRHRRQYAGGMPLSYLNTRYSEPGTSSTAGSNLMISEPGLARPSINHTGGKRSVTKKSRKNNSQTRRINRRNHRVRASSTRCRVCVKKGGFTPSVMGSFIQNASRLMPIAGVTGYRMWHNFSKTKKNRY
jgi:hypothetical protein